MENCILCFDDVAISWYNLSICCAGKTLYREIATLVGADAYIRPRDDVGIVPYGSQ